MNNNEHVSDQVFHVLITLVDGPLHGYGIIQEVESRTEGALQLGTSTLYSAIGRMRARGWVSRVEVSDSDDPRRKYYGLTDTGRNVVQAEARRLVNLVEYARAKDLLGSAGEP